MNNCARVNVAGGLEAAIRATIEMVAFFAPTTGHSANSRIFENGAQQDERPSSFVLQFVRGAEWNGEDISLPDLGLVRQHSQLTSSSGDQMYYVAGTTTPRIWYCENTQSQAVT